MKISESTLFRFYADFEKDDALEHRYGMRQEEQTGNYRGDGKKKQLGAVNKIEWKKDSAKK